MEIGRAFARGELSWRIRYRSDEPRGDSNFSGKIEIELLEPDDVEFPVKTGVRDAEQYISFESESPATKINSSTKAELEFEIEKRGDINDKRKEDELEGDEEKRCEVWFTDEGDRGGNYACTFVSEEVVSLCLQILSDDVDDDEVLEQMNTEYGNNPPAYTGLRRKSRYCTDFSDHVEVLNFLYKHTNPGALDDSAEQEIFRFIKNRVIETNGSYQSYKSNSVADLEEKISICESKTFLPEISEKDELVGLQHLKLADGLVDDGEFRKAKEQISEAIDRFEQSGSEELLPAELKRDAILGLLDESRRDFEQAASHYSDAAEEATDTKNIRAYEVWSDVTKVKELLSEGEFEKARELLDQIEYNQDNIYLIDFQKLTMLFDLYSEYTQDGRSDPTAVFAEVGIEDKTKLPSSDAIVQFNTDYSAAFTMLITKQRKKQLGVDSEIGDDSRAIIRDAITPTGINRDPNHKKQSDQGGTQQHHNVSDVEEKPEDDFERNYTETKRAQRDVQFQENVKKAYNQSCAVCGSNRMTPDGRPEVEAAHIRPVSEGGKDIITNGIALCRLHHWAFDNDWISVDNDYSVMVKDASGVSGYEDFAQHQGSRLNLPEADENRPKKEAIEFHRRYHGFEDN